MWLWVLVPEPRFGELWTLFMGESVNDKATLLRAYPPLSEKSQPGRWSQRQKQQQHMHMQIYKETNTHTQMHRGRNITQTSGGKAHAFKELDFYCISSEYVIKEYKKNQNVIVKYSRSLKVLYCISLHLTISDKVCLWRQELHPFLKQASKIKTHYHDFSKTNVIHEIIMRGIC